MICGTKFPPWHPLLTAQKTCFHHHTGTQLDPHPHHHSGSSSVRGHKRDLQLFLGHFFHTVICCPLALLPPSLSLLHLPSFSCPLFHTLFPKAIFLFHLGAPFLSRTVMRGDTSVAFATIFLSEQMVLADSIASCSPG